MEEEPQAACVCQVHSLIHCSLHRALILTLLKTIIFSPLTRPAKKESLEAAWCRWCLGWFLFSALKIDVDGGETQHTHTTAFTSLLGERSKKKKKDIYILLAGYVCAENSITTSTSSSSCLSLYVQTPSSARRLIPHMLPHCLPLARETNSVFPTGVLSSAWIKTNPNENKTEQNNASSSQALSLPNHLCIKNTNTHTVFLKLYHFCFYVPVEVWTYCQLMHSLWP